jgi:hypothetical protein
MSAHFCDGAETRYGVKLENWAVWLKWSKDEARHSVAESAGLAHPTGQPCVAPTVSAILAPRLPSGFGWPAVLSRTV